MTRRGRIAALAGVAAIALGVVVYLGWPGGGPVRAGAHGPGAPATTAAPTAAEGTAAGAVVRTPALTAAVEPYPEHGTDGISTDDPLTAYRRANVYPPTSRPLTAEHVDLLHPNDRHETAVATDADEDTTYLFTADRYYAIGDDSVTATLEAWHRGSQTPVKVTQAFAVVLHAGTPPSKDAAIPIAYAMDGGRAIGRFAPAAIKGLDRQTGFGMYIEFEVGGATQRAHFDFQYTPTAGIPARFTGAFTDAIVDGSLVVGARVEVAREGAYVIDCNLYDADDNPVAWTRFKGTLATGAQTANLVFFGKVIVDAGAHGPFHIGQLRGARFDAGRDPDLEQMPYFTGSYTTRPYQTSELSGAEWDSPEKDRMLEMLAADAARGVHRGATAPGDPGRPGSDH